MSETLPPETSLDQLFIDEAMKVREEPKKWEGKMPPLSPEQMAHEVQRGKFKGAMYEDLSEQERRLIDMEYIKENYAQLLGKIIRVLLQKHGGFFGGKIIEKEGEVGQKVVFEEEAIIREIVQNFGPESQYHFDECTCRELFFSAKEWIYNKAVLEESGKVKEQLPKVAAEKPLSALGLGGKAEVIVEEKKNFFSGKKLEFAKGIVGLGIGFGAILAWGGIGIVVTGVYRAVDDWIRERWQEKNVINKWKEKWQKDEEKQRDLKEYLAFVIANLREARIRQERTGRVEGIEEARNYQHYFENTRRLLENERNVNQAYNEEHPEEERPIYSDEEIRQMAEAWAIFYYSDDRSEQSRIENQSTRPTWTQQALDFIDGRFGRRVNRARGVFGIVPSSGRDKFFAGMTAIGVSLACFTASRGKDIFLRDIAAAYAGWKLGGMFGDFLGKKQRPEIITENSLRRLEEFLATNRNREFNLNQIGAQIAELTNLRGELEQIKNPIEYARQKERFKKIMMELLMNKILLEHEKRWDVEIEGVVPETEEPTEEETVTLGGRIAEEITSKEEFVREEKIRQERRSARKRWAWRVGGAVCGFLLADPNIHKWLGDWKDYFFPEKEIIAGGPVAGGIVDDAHEKILRPVISPAESVPAAGHEALSVPEVVAGPYGIDSGVVTAHQGDTLWSIINQKCETIFGNNFTNLDEGHKTFIIDSIKDKVATNPNEYGLTDIDKIIPGQKIDLTDIFKDDSSLKEIFSNAGNLTEDQIKNIVHNNQILENWVKTHPHEFLTTEKVGQILSQTGGETAIHHAGVSASIMSQTGGAGTPPTELPIAEAGISEATIVGSSTLTGAETMHPMQKALEETSAGYQPTTEELNKTVTYSETGTHTAGVVLSAHEVESPTTGVAKTIFLTKESLISNLKDFLHLSNKEAIRMDGVVKNCFFDLFEKQHESLNMNGLTNIINHGNLVDLKNNATEQITEATAKLKELHWWQEGTYRKIIEDLKFFLGKVKDIK